MTAGFSFNVEEEKKNLSSKEPHIYGSLTMVVPKKRLRRGIIVGQLAREN